jgi:hypothetical protein
MNRRLILFWLCGVWAAGVGLRLLVELLMGGAIVIPSSVVNVWFDLIPLTIFGLGTAAVVIYDLCKAYFLKRKKEGEV